MKIVIRNLAAGAALLAALALVPATAPAYMGGDGPPQSGSHFKKMAKELHLTPQQKQQIKDIFAKNRSSAQPLMKQLMTERRSLRNLVQADTIDEAGIRAQSANVAAVQADLAVNRAHVAQEMRAVLTPEQIAKSRELQAQRDKKMEERAARPGKRFKQEP
ncbi:MAG: Spy/CpxP family protein refolding chaperone [Desulfuromonadales bacterium]|nr:Spy/CpxP family protein refolding chaperone [Desulfuromonadales bacterium]